MSTFLVNNNNYYDYQSLALLTPLYRFGGPEWIKVRISARIQLMASSGVPLNLPAPNVWIAKNWDLDNLLDSEATPAVIQTRWQRMKPSRDGTYQASVFWRCHSAKGNKGLPLGTSNVLNPVSPFYYGTARYVTFLNAVNTLAASVPNDREYLNHTGFKTSDIMRMPAFKIDVPPAPTPGTGGTVNLTMTVDWNVLSSIKLEGRNEVAPAKRKMQEAIDAMGEECDTKRARCEIATPSGVVFTK